MKYFTFSVLLLLPTANAFAQSNGIDGTFRLLHPHNYAIKQAIELESIVPMFFTGRYRFAVGYRYFKFSVRASIINGGTYDAEKVGLKNSPSIFKRFYYTSPGIFLGYNVWRNLGVYTYFESRTLIVKQTSTGIEKKVKSIDTGLGLSHQFFIGRYFYVQPGVHLYLRTNKTVNFFDVQYRIAHADISSFIRLGVRL